MAQENRTDLKATILANIPNNITEEITPEKHREVEDNIADSNYNILTDNAFIVNYQPTTPLDWGATVPTETGEALDILIKKVSTNASLKVAYVAENGSDVVNEFEVGNPLKPFATISAAWDAVGTNSAVIVLGGTYTETFSKTIATNKSLIMYNVNLTGDITISNSTGLVMDFQGCTINGAFDATGGSNHYANFTNTEITGEVRLQNFNMVEGGKFGRLDDSLNSNFNKIEVDYTGAARAVQVDGDIYNSIINAPNSAIGVQSSGYLYNCKIDAATCYNGAGKAIMYNCELKSTQFTLRPAASGAINVICYNCRFECTGVGFSNLRIDQNSQFLYFKDCVFVSQADNVDFNNFGTTCNRAAGTVNAFENCRFIAGTGFPVREPNSGYNVGDQGDLLVINSIINKATLTSVAPVKVTDNNTYVYLNLQDVN